MSIRTEEPRDEAAIRRIHIEAFANHPYSHQNEHLIVEALRRDKALVLGLVAENETLVQGHVAFSEVRINGLCNGWYGLGPIGVLPAFQKQGIGSALIKAGLVALREQGAAGCVLVGDPAYYGRFGFLSRSELNLPGVAHAFVLALPLRSSIPCGTVAFHPCFA